MTKKFEIRVQFEDFDIDKENKFLCSDNTGAIVNFVGVVRNRYKNKNILSLFLEHYPTMTENEISKIIKEADIKWKLDKITVIHRVGKLLPNENIVYVGISSVHRQNAFDAANFIIDWLKTKAPIWKLEEFEKERIWVKERNQDEKALNKWTL